jgi:DNA repair protein RadD
MMDLYEFQLEAVVQILVALEDGRNPLLVAPTGSGKTVIISRVIAHLEHKHVLFLAHRRELIHQTKDKLARFDVPAGVILAGEPMDQMRRVQVASIQTFSSRYMRGKHDLPPADIIVIDEAHHARARTYVDIVKAYPDARIVGMSATPCRRDGRGLGGTFDVMVETPAIAELIRLKHLVPTINFAPSIPDLKGVHTRHGDYAEAELAQIMDHGLLVADIVSTWHRLAERRRTVVFATSVGHSIHITGEFQKSGVRAEHIDGSTPKEERDQILHLLASGEIEVVSNCMVLTEGWDCPTVSCCVLARPTKSLGLHLQMAGRVIRPAPGKRDAIVLDHAGNVIRHGFVEEPINWTLDPDLKATKPAQISRQSSPSSRLTDCPKCSAIRIAGQPCGQCGYLPNRAAAHLHVVDGDLALLDRDKVHPSEHSAERKREFHGMLLWIAGERGYKPGWAAYKYKERFKHWPIGRPEPIKPSAEVTSWVRSRNIAFAKSQGKASNG